MICYIFITGSLLNNNNNKVYVNFKSIFKFLNSEMCLTIKYIAGLTTFKSRIKFNYVFLNTLCFSLYKLTVICYVFAYF